VISKSAKNMERALNFHDSLSKKFHCGKRTPQKIKNKAFMFELYNLVDPMEFLSLRLKKITSRSYGYFYKVPYFIVLEKWFLQLCQNCIVL
jgi:hypothetical protein